MLERIVQALEARLARLFGRSEAESATDELSLKREALAGYQARREEVRRRLCEMRRREEELTAGVASALKLGLAAKAYERALELERLRQEAAQQKAQLPRLEQVCWSLEFDIRQQERKRQQAQREAQARPRGKA
jgi:hypothetical protein